MNFRHANDDFVNKVICFKWWLRCSCSFVKVLIKEIHSHHCTTERTWNPWTHRVVMERVYRGRTCTLPPKCQIGLDQGTRTGIERRQCYICTAYKCRMRLEGDESISRWDFTNEQRIYRVGIHRCQSWFCKAGNGSQMVAQTYCFHQSSEDRKSLNIIIAAPK